MKGMNTTIQHIILLPGTNVIHIFHQKSKKKFIKRQLKLIVMTGLSRLDMIKHLISCSLLVGAILLTHEAMSSNNSLNNLSITIN
jgi:hypothetical protein